MSLPAGTELNDPSHPQYYPKKSSCEWTARQWLIKLGWRLTVLQKGVYMDGHE
jgi:hypothetical protein